MSLGPLMIGIEGIALTERESDWLRSPLVGGVILFARNYQSRSQLEQLVGDIHAVRQPPLLVGVDQEGGRVQRFGSPFTRLPAPRSIGHLFDESPGDAISVARDVGWLMASELRACDIDLSFTPVVELDRGLADVIGDRAYHHDASTVSKLAAATMRGMREAGMVATAKHFPTHAGAHSDSHAELAVDRRDFDQLLDDLEPYSTLIDQGLQSIMISHVIFPTLDPLPASLSPWWIRTQLRSEMGFGGVTVSDDIGMAGAAVAGRLEERAQKALEAGCDLVLACECFGDIPVLLEALRGYSDPSAQLRLMRLRGGLRQDWFALQSSQEWLTASKTLGRLDSPPALELEG
jgi:beta-N-acetylhexosaminidase